MENEILITAIFVSAGLLAYVIIPGMLVIWDRVLDHMESTGSDRLGSEKTIILDTSGTGEQKK